MTVIAKTPLATVKEKITEPPRVREFPRGVLVQELTEVDVDERLYLLKTQTARLKFTAQAAAVRVFRDADRFGLIQICDVLDDALLSIGLATGDLEP